MVMEIVGTLKTGFPCIQSLSRQGAGRASTRCHVNCSFGPHLSVEVSSGAATCPAAPDLTTLLRWVPAPPCVPQFWTSPPCWGELRRCHVSHGPGPRLLTEVSSVLPHVPRPRVLPSWEGSSGAATCPMARGCPFLGGELQCCHMSHGPRQAVDHNNKKKCLAFLGTQLGSHIFQARSCVTVAPADVQTATV
jgi:hypothetical protein